MRHTLTIALTLVALVATGFETPAAYARSFETPVPDGCVKRLGRDGNYICCGGPVIWHCTKLPSRIPGKLMG